MHLLLGDKLWKTNVVVLDAAESGPLQEESPEVAVLWVNNTQSFVLASLTFCDTKVFGSKTLF